MNLDGECHFWRKAEAATGEVEEEEEEPEFCMAPPDEDDGPPACALTGDPTGEGHRDGSPGARIDMLCPRELLSIAESYRHMTPPYTPSD